MPPVRRATRKNRSNEGIKTRNSKKSNKPLPLVERTNKLSREEFISLYIPPEELKFQKSKTFPNSAGKDIHLEEKDCADTTKDSYVLDIYTAATIPTTDLEACFNLIELTSSEAYKSSSLGWSATDKKEEMRLPDMKYMILRRGDGCLDDGGGGVGEFLGFLEFMVTYEDGLEVGYCYEIHLVPEAQRQRLGEELMSRFERIGARIGLEKTMLTMFKSNVRAAVFYTRAGYMEDESSPQPRRLRNGTVKEADYRIMSKPLVKG